MADALLSPAVGGVMWAAAAATLVHCSRRLQHAGDDRRVPLMGVLGAFLFAAQMINFSLPGTGSSGHLGGGLLLAILLGPHAACLVMASVLVVQALFFADGGLLALGCNIFNLGILPAFVAYPVYRWLAGSGTGALRGAAAAVLAAVLSLQLGAVAVVVQTVASGISALPWPVFAAFMLPIHAGIGVVEGLATAALVSFVRRERPDLLAGAAPAARPAARLLAIFLTGALATGGVGAWFASQDPDGLEWSIERATGGAPLQPPATAVHETLGRWQERLAVLPDYGFRDGGTAAPSAAPAPGDVAAEARLGSSLAGTVGGALTLVLALLAGLTARRLSLRR